MQMSAEQRIGAPRHVVWQALNDPQILKQCISGCETIERVSDSEFVAEVTAKVGPVKARFKGLITLSEIDPPNGYRISGEGKGGAAGFAKGGAVIRLADDGSGTLLSYDVDATIGGKLAQIGSRLIDAAARKFADDFFAHFHQLVSGEQPAAPAHPLAAEPGASQPMPQPMPVEATGEGTGEATGEGGVGPAIWVPGLILIVILLMFLFAAGR